MRRLTKLRIDEISSVDRGAGEGCKIMFYKRDDGDAYFKIKRTDDDTPYLFNDIMRKAAEEDELRGPRDENDDDKVQSKLRQMVAALITAAPSLREDQAMHFILHTPHGRKMFEHFSKAKEPQMPQVDIMKVIEVTEAGLMATVVKRDGERYDTAFARKFENDIDFRKQWRDLTEAKHLLIAKGMASLMPTSVEVGNTNVTDDSAEAVRLLAEMATKNGRSFETEFADPANVKLAAQTYTQHHRSSTSGDELQRR
jgi:hypothetical protein